MGFVLGLIFMLCISLFAIDDAKKVNKNYIFGGLSIGENKLYLSNWSNNSRELFQIKRIK
jgi:hypothetical protein